VGKTETDIDARPGAPVESEPEPRPRSRTRPLIGEWLARYWLLLALLTVAAVVSIVVRHVVYPALSWNRDESTYLWQARALGSGQLLTTTGGLPQFFQPWLTGVTHGQFYSQYTLGWPGVMLVADQLFGSPAASIWWGTVVAILGTYLFVREITRDHWLSLLTATLVLASPMIITQSGQYLGYLFSLGIGLLFGAALLAGLRRRSGWLAVVAGAFLGIVFVTRPYDAVLWAVAMGGYAVFLTWREWAHQLRTVGLVFLGFLPFVVLTLAHNRIVTGSFTQFPFSAKEPLDKFGFGYRRLMPHIVGIDYTVGQAVRGSVVEGLYVPQFLIGTYVGLLTAGAGLWLRRRDRTTLLLLAIMVVFPAGYFVFWGNRLASGFAFLSGPVYFIPLFVPLCLFIATALIALWRRRRAALVVLLCVFVVATVPFLYDKSRMNHTISAAQEPWRHATDALPGRSLVIVRDSGPYLLHLNPFSENAPDLDGRVLFAVDRFADSFRLLDHYPNRTPYVERTNYRLLDNPVKHPDAKVPTITVLPIAVKSGPVVTLKVQMRNPTNEAAVVATLKIGNVVDQRALSPSPSGSYETQWTLVPASAVDVPDDAIRVRGQGLFTVSGAVGATSAQAATGRQVREEYAFRVHDGAVQVLDPPRKSVIFAEPGRIVQHDVGSLSKLHVDVSA